MTPALLEKEIDHYNKIRDELLGKAKNDYALIHGDELIDTFKSKDDAIKKGYEMFGNKPFLVKKISEIEKTFHFTSNLIARCA
jgi:hypothetical protein